MKSKHLFSSGFTLIEVMVVITLSVILMLGASAMFFMTILGNSKAVVTQKLKGDGEFTLGQMEFLIRNSLEIVPNSLDQTCEMGMSELSIKSLDGNITTLTKVADEYDADKIKIASVSSVYSLVGYDIVNLQGAEVEVPRYDTVDKKIFLMSETADLVSGPTFDCVQDDSGVSPSVTINFSLRRGTPGIDQARDIIEEDFQTTVTLRSY